MPRHRRINIGKILVITNRKGGCGKTVTTASHGVGLARRGKKVLLIDADNQHSLTVSMGVAEPDELPVTPKFLDAKGLELLLKSIVEIREDINLNLSICDILLTIINTS